MASSHGEADQAHRLRLVVDVDAVETARGLDEYGEIYLGIHALLHAIGPSSAGKSSHHQAQYWSCLMDLLNKAVVRQAAEDAYEITSFLDRFGIDLDDNDDDWHEDRELFLETKMDAGHSPTEELRYEDEQLHGSSPYECSSSRGHRESTSPRSPSSHVSNEITCSGGGDDDVSVSTTTTTKRQRLRRIKQRWKDSISSLFKSSRAYYTVTETNEETNIATRPRLWWWWWYNRRRCRAVSVSNQVEHSNNSSDGGLSCSSINHEQSQSSSRSFAPWTNASEYEYTGVSERSVTTTSVAMMETSASASALAINQVDHPAVRDASGIDRFFGSFRFRAAPLWLVSH